MIKENAVDLPVRFPLHDDDVLFFMHIPKTGGLSLIEILDRHFPANEICPLHSDPTGELFGRPEPAVLATYRLVHGHFRFGPFDQAVWRYLTPNPVLVTMLREPIARIVSAYQHNIRKQHIPADTTLLTFVTAAEYQSRVWNTQARWLAGKVRGNCGWGEPNSLSAAAIQYLAKANLGAFAFFGITEQFETSVELLTHTFGWPAAADIPHANRDPRPFKPVDIEPRVRAEIEARTQVDQAVYAFAVALFEERCQRMRAEQANNQRRVAASPKSNWRLNWNRRRRIRQRIGWRGMINHEFFPNGWRYFLLPEGTRRSRLVHRLRNTLRRQKDSSL